MVAPFADQHAKRGIGRLDPDPEEIDRRLDQDRRRKVERHVDQKDRKRVGQNGAERNAPRARPDDPLGLHIGLGQGREPDGPRQPGIPLPPIEHHDDQKERHVRFGKGGEDRQRQDQEGQGRREIDKHPHQMVGPSADPGRGEPRGGGAGAEDRPANRPNGGDEEADLDAAQGAGQHVAAQAVRPEGMLPTAAEEDRRLEPLQQVLRGDVMWREGAGKERRHGQQGHQPAADAHTPGHQRRMSRMRGSNTP